MIVMRLMALAFLAVIMRALFAIRGSRRASRGGPLAADLTEEFLRS